MNIIIRLLKLAGVDTVNLKLRISILSLKSSVVLCGRKDLIRKLREIAPDISNQESSSVSNSLGTRVFSEYIELKRRALHAFQCDAMLRAVSTVEGSEVTVVDIGDSAGTHMRYLKELIKERFALRTISVNLDKRAIKRIQAAGQTALLCRAEDLNLGEQQIDLFTSFEMVEHLHNPAIFFRRLAKKSVCGRILISVPYRAASRVGLHSVRQRMAKDVTAEEEHIFELSPGDWELLFLHSGWRVKWCENYFQYPKAIPVLSYLLAKFWEHVDFEGFWCAYLERDLTFSDHYLDWET